MKILELILKDIWNIICEKREKHVEYWTYDQNSFGMILLGCVVFTLTCIICYGLSHVFFETYFALWFKILTGIFITIVFIFGNYFTSVVTEASIKIFMEIYDFKSYWEDLKRRVNDDTR